MALPNIVTPEFDTTIPSTKEPIKFRPFLVKEEKILYMAMESNEQKDIFNAITKILKECILTEGVDTQKFTAYDLEYLFLKLRSKSVGEVIKVSLNHECGKANEIEINLDSIEVKFNDEHNYKIDIGNGIGMVMTDPMATMFSNINEKESEFSQFIDIIIGCVDVVYDENEVYNDFTREEMREFIEKLTKEQFEKLVEFFNTIPKLSHDVEYTCEHCGKEESQKIEGLQSFFT